MREVIYSGVFFFVLFSLPVFFLFSLFFVGVGFAQCCALSAYPFPPPCSGSEIFRLFGWLVGWWGGGVGGGGGEFNSKNAFLFYFVRKTTRERVTFWVEF